MPKNIKSNGGEENNALVKIDNKSTWLTCFRDKCIAILNIPFRRRAEKMLRTLRGLGLNSDEKNIIDDSVDNKYVPSLRDSTLYALLATPGIMTINNTGQIEFVLAITASVTGIAWFAISLKEVKSKFSDFGVELTGNMLKAFLSTLFIISITAGLSMISAPIQWIIQTAEENGIDPKEIFSSVALQSGLQITSLCVGAGIIRNLIRATIQFDANDAMLTGSSDAAKTYFNRAISDLRNTASLLKEPHSLEAANFQINQGISRVYQSLHRIEGINVKNIISREDLDYFADSTDARQSDFDNKLLPILKKLILLFEDLVKQEDDETIQIETDMATKAIAQLQERYKDENEPDQQYADAVIANSIEIIADLIERYGDDLEKESI